LYNTILVPLDGSELAESVIPLAAAIAKATAARLRLVHVEDSGPIGRAQMPDAAKYLDRMTEALSADLLESVDTAVIPLGGAALTRRDTAALISKYAEQHASDLIVMSTRGHSGLRRVFEGSVAEALLRVTPCPVLFCPRPGGRLLRPGPHPIRKVLIALDQSQSSEHILESAVAIAKALHAEVVLLHVLPPYRAVAAVTGMERRGYSEADWEQLNAQADEYLAGIEQQLASADVQSTTEKAVSDDVAAAILDAAVRSDADMIALASRTPGGLVRAFFGSVGDRLVRGAPCPVLVTRASG
jgi:nucleotide-binding universal stress UspA family protein